MQNNAQSAIFTLFLKYDTEKIKVKIDRIFVECSFFDENEF